MDLIRMISSWVILRELIQLSTSPRFVNLKKRHTHKMSLELSFPVGFYNHEGCMGSPGLKPITHVTPALGWSSLLLPYLFLSYSCYACEPRLPVQASERDLHPSICSRPLRCGNDEEGARVGWAQLWSLPYTSRERDTITADSLPLILKASLPIFKHLKSDFHPCQLSSMESLFSWPTSLFPQPLTMNEGTCELPGEWEEVIMATLCVSSRQHLPTASSMDSPV